MSENLPRWNLSSLYASLQDPRLESDLEAAPQRTAQFCERWRSLIVGAQYTPAQLAQALREYEELNIFLTLPSVYADLLFAADSGNPQLGAFSQRCNELLSRLSSQLLFMELSLSQVEDETWRQWQEAPELQTYLHYLGALRQERPYTLPEGEEKILEEMAPSGRRAFRRLFTETVSRLTYPIELEEGTKELTQSELLALSHHPQREVRRQAAQVLSQVLERHAHALHFTFNTLLLDKLTTDRLRGFPRPESSRNLANELPDSSVDLVVKVVRDHYHLAAQYYHLKKRLLGVSKLYHYDRYAPLEAVQERIPYAKAQAIVLEALREFSPSLGELAQSFFSQNWIDVPPAPGKRGGAFCAGVAPGHHPYILLNYTGNPRDVQTLAHELGHGLHDLLADKQNYFDYHPVLPLAETASTFMETLVFEKLYQGLEKPSDKLALLAAKIEDSLATVFRQVAMYTFEQRVYAARAKEGELSLERLNGLWQTSIQEMFGDSLELGPDHAITWIYVPHFVQTPFYVYAYAFGDLLAYALYARCQREGQAFKERYLDFLASGGSATPKQLLERLGIELENPQFWREGCALIARNIERARELADLLEGARQLQREDRVAEEMRREAADSGWGEGDQDGWDGEGEDFIDPQERGF